eukprot:365626-Chlamydomonas_euryale.AAC.7
MSDWADGSIGDGWKCGERRVRARGRPFKQPLHRQTDGWMDAKTQRVRVRVAVYGPNIGMLICQADLPSRATGYPLERQRRVKGLRAARQHLHKCPPNERGPAALRGLGQPQRLSATGCKRAPAAALPHGRDPAVLAVQGQPEGLWAARLKGVSAAVPLLVATKPC